MISTLILTKNEENDLKNCLDSLQWCDDIHVFDSLSEDLTVDVAVSFGAKVQQRRFDNYSSQRNSAIGQCQFRYQWLLILDADETIPEETSQILNQAVNGVGEDVCGFRLRRRDFFGNTWLKYSQISPYYVRLVKLGKASYHREINEILEVDGKIEDLDVHFNHYPFSKGIDHWILKHNQYSKMEAKRLIEETSGMISFSIKTALFGKDFNVRRFHQKGLFYKIPFRPLFKGLYMIFGRFAFLDGKAGLTYTYLQCIYEYMIVLKTREMLKKLK